MTIKEFFRSKVISRLYHFTDRDNLITFTANGVSFTMVRVQGGTFTMGVSDSDLEGFSNSDNNWILKTSRPCHQVTLSDYYIGQTEVTQALWQAVMGNNPSRFKGSENPVESVSWNDCQEFIKKLNALTGKTFSLPTEAQWEFAARGGNKSKGYKYAGSNNLDEVAWYYDNSYDKGENHPDNGTHPVATKQPNELGLYDMSGNVWEWCNDWYKVIPKDFCPNFWVHFRYGDYGSSAQTNPIGSSTGSSRVFRGGSWCGNAGFCRVSFRSFNSPDFRCYHHGFRLSLVP